MQAIFCHERPAFKHLKSFLPQSDDVVGRPAENEHAHDDDGHLERARACAVQHAAGATEAFRGGTTAAAAVPAAEGPAAAAVSAATEYARPRG